MKLSQLFEKDINRKINGVVQVGNDDIDSIVTELNEFVVTDELRKHFSNFFQALTETESSPTEDIGIWISGYFGSGKSHFLKMLGYMLKNNEINGKKAIDYFEDKFSDNLWYQDIRAFINRSNIDVILFNIQSYVNEAYGGKSGATVVEACMDRFFANLGFISGKNWLAHQEWRLWKAGEYEDFKKNFKDEAGFGWDEKDGGRENIDFERQSAVRALVKTKNDKGHNITEEEAKNYFDGSYQAKTYSLSAKSFAEIVDEYCKLKGKNHKIMFLIDEVGQFVANDVKLMLDLQTITEEFRKLRGTAWIAVTAQQAIDKVVQIEGQAADDFSRIQARFRTKLSLSSTNVDEVIKKRLLLKTEPAISELSEIFKDKQHTISNMFSFRGTVKNIDHFYYKEEKEFNDLYPLVPYQVDLTKQVLKKVSDTGYAGGHLSVGERSVLDIFHIAISSRSDDELGYLVPFDVVYDANEASFTQSVKTIIANAEKHSDVDKTLGIRVLKVLFLLKYVDWIPLTLDNITILLIDNIETGTLELKNKVFKALESLKGAGFINQRAEDYEFLSDEEQEIEREIKTISIDNNEVYAAVYKHFFEDQPFGKLVVEKHDYDFIKLIDTYCPGRLNNDVQKLSLQICTPWFNATSAELVGKDYETKIVLSKPENGSENDPMKCIVQYLRIQKWIKINDKDSSAAERINHKTAEMQSFKNKAKELLDKAVIGGQYFRGTTEVHINKQSFKEIALELLNDAFENSYTEFYKLPTSKDQDLSDMIRLRQQKGLLDNIPLSTAHEYVMNTIRIDEGKGKNITLASLQLQYKDMPYGWKDSDVNKLIFELWASKKIILKYSGKEILFDDDNIIDYLSKANYKDKIEIEKKQEIGEDITRSICDILVKIDRSNSTFKNAIESKEQDDLRGAISSWKDNTIKFIDEKLGSYDERPYPGKLALEKMKDTLDDIKGFWTTAQLFDYFINESENIIDTYNEFSVVKSFFEDQKPIWLLGYNELEKYKKLRTDVYKEVKDQHEKLKGIIEDSHPYDRIPEIRKLNKDLEDFYTNLLNTKKKELSEKIEVDEKDITEKYKEKVGDDRGKIERAFMDQKRLIEGIDKYESLGSLSDEYSDWLSGIITKCLEFIQLHTVKTTTQTTTTDGGETTSTTTIEAKIKVKPIKLISLLPSDKRTISSEDEIDGVLAAIKEKLQNDMKDGGMIILS